MTASRKAQFRERLMRDLAETLRQKIAAHHAKNGKMHLQATVSLGLAGCLPDHMTPPEHANLSSIAGEGRRSTAAMERGTILRKLHRPLCFG